MKFDMEKMVGRKIVRMFGLSDIDREGMLNPNGVSELSELVKKYHLDGGFESPYTLIRKK